MHVYPFNGFLDVLKSELAKNVSVPFQTRLTIYVSDLNNQKCNASLKNR